jgi:hypothetical protein
MELKVFDIAHNSAMRRKKWLLQQFRKLMKLRLRFSWMNWKNSKSELLYKDD